MTFPWIAALLLVALGVAFRTALLCWRARSRGTQALIVTLQLPPNSRIERLHELEEKLAVAVEQAAAGTLRGDRFGAGSVRFYLEGASAERLYRAVLPPLEEFGPGAELHRIERYGADGALEERVELTCFSPPATIH